MSQPVIKAEQIFYCQFSTVHSDILSEICGIECCREVKTNEWKIKIGSSVVIVALINMVMQNKSNQITHITNSRAIWRQDIKKYTKKIGSFMILRPSLALQKRN